ncbi:hypothetical protein QTH87_09320 [Variovorax sp. J22P168]|uniref:hypothetical protein n=1 Tax=Variovorax jilinensis TaxID=3053513 RepID=UPI0025787343|nr:hypothetical protein [Variovorax sp. J22P168]MDM0012627.1 hypothetical protein [Variovorax sp. J22P168]
MRNDFISVIPPGPGGVFDYAHLMGRGLDAPVVELAADSRIDGYGGRLLCLHFSGYGFQKRGVPFWLLRAMREMRPRFDNIGIVFHELFATGPPWRSAFWVSGMQKHIARELLGLADFWITSREGSARWLHGVQKREVPHRVLPIFSNVGEPDPVDQPRQPRLVVFGTREVREKAYAWQDGEIFRCAQRLGLRIHDIGASFAAGTLIAARLGQAEAVVHGKLPAEAVSALLSESSHGVVAYQLHFVAKSGIFAAYAAHGACPVLLAPSYEEADGLVAGRHYLAGFESVGQPSFDAALIGRQARDWYQPHCIAVHQAALLELDAEARRAKSLPLASAPAAAHGLGTQR